MVAIRRTTALLMTLVLAFALTLTTDFTLDDGIAAATDSRVEAAANDNIPWTLPTRPPKCTSKQITAGTVAECLVANYNSPEVNGWPTPPFPSDPAADSDVGVLPLADWNFAGWGYNASPALTDWEALLVGNQSTIGRVKSNQLRSLPDALPLFEGFIRDIVAGGYKLTDVATYSFRCTSGSGKSCKGLTRDSLSNHTWGLAIDMNSGTNPETTYLGIDGASACATPITTDIPMWVVRAAEKWGLYWGGYGWSSGCDSPDQMKASAGRDATHFEFRGTPAQARAIAAVNFGGACLATVDDTGASLPRCLAQGDIPGTGWRVVIDTKAPKGATAALVNIAMTDARAAGYVTAESCSTAPPGPRSTANGNTAQGQTVANLAVVPLDSAGRFCLYRSQPMHTIVDVQGFFVPATSAGSTATLYNPVAPQRVMDTRATPFCNADGSCVEHGPAAAGAEVAVTMPMVPTGAVAVLANLAVTEPGAAGYLTADSCTALVPGPQSHASANFGLGETIANLSVIPVTPSAPGAQFCMFSTAQTHTVVDVQGYFAPPTPAGLAFTLLPTQRLVDTRGCWSDAATGLQQCAQINPAGSVIRLRAPTGATAVLINLALTDASADGFATAEACTLLQGTPEQSNGNVTRGRTAANLAVVAVDPDGTFCVRVSAPMHVIVDLQGMFSPGGPLMFVPLPPVRRSDTRMPGG